MAKTISQLEILAALTGNDYVAVATLSDTVTITATTISANASDNSFNDSGSGFLAAGFAAGDRVKVEGFTGNVANNIRSLKLTSVTATKMIAAGVDGDAIVNDAAGESVTISKWINKRIALTGDTLTVYGTNAGLQGHDHTDNGAEQPFLVMESAVGAGDTAFWLWRTGDQSSHVGEPGWLFPTLANTGTAGGYERVGWLQSTIYDTMAELLARDTSLNEPLQLFTVKETVADAADKKDLLWRGGDQSANDGEEGWYMPDVPGDGSTGAYQFTGSAPAAGGPPQYDTTQALKDRLIADNTPELFIIVKESVAGAADGYFVLWRDGDQSSHVGEEGWIFPTEDATGASGAYQVTGSAVAAEGGSGNGTTYWEVTQQTLSGGETAITVPEYTLGLTEKEYVYSLNGKDYYPTDYTETDTTTITLNEAAAPGEFASTRLIGAGGGGGASVTEEEAGTTYTLVLADDGKLKVFTDASGCALTVPLQTSVAWADNAEVEFIGEFGPIPVTGEGAVAIIYPDDMTSAVQAKSTALLKRIREDVWVLSGRWVPA